MSVLLLDIGNTRMKWCVLANLESSVQNIGFIDTHAAWELCNDGLVILEEALCAHLPLTAVYAVKVAQPVWMEHLQAWLQLRGVPLYWLTSSLCMAGVYNTYTAPEQLGADRWAMAIATVGFFPGQACVVMGAGTATTLDAIDENGVFLGGLIMPGLQSMLDILHRHTAQLPAVVWNGGLSSKDWHGDQQGLVGAVHDWPRRTVDAMVMGVLEAHVGAAQRLVHRLQQYAQTGQVVQVIIAGGNACHLAPHLAGSVVQPHWVLEGVRMWAKKL